MSNKHKPKPRKPQPAAEASPAHSSLAIDPPAQEAGEPAIPIEDPARPGRSTWKALLVPLLIFWLLGVVNLFHPLLFSRYLGDIGDTRLNLFFLEHQYKVLTDKAYPGSYASAPIWYPESENSMARSDMLTGAQPFYFLPRLFLSRDQAYQAFFLIAATLNFLVFFGVCRSLGVDSPVVAALAAWVFAFGMHKVQHTVHTQFFIQFWGAGFWLCLIRLMKSPSRLLVFSAVLLLGLQTLASPYSGVFYSLAGILFAGIYMLLVDRRTALRLWFWVRKDFFGIAGAAATAAAPVLWLLSPYTKAANLWARHWEDAAASIARPDFWFLPMQSTLWWFAAHLSKTWFSHETYFLGAVFSLLCLGSLAAFAFHPPWREDNRNRLAAALVALSVLLLLLVIRLVPGWSPWHAIYDWFPGAKGIRDIPRITMVANLAMLLAGGLFLDGLARRAGVRMGRLLIYGCAAFALLENFMPLSLAYPMDISHPGMYTYPSNWYGRESEDIAELLSGAPAAYVYRDSSLPDFAHEDAVQLIGQRLDMPVVNGTSGSLPPGFHDRMSPREVLAMGTKFDFTGFRYLVPISQEAALNAEIRQAGLSFVRRGEFFAAYQPYGPKPNYDVDFRILSTVPEKLKPGQWVPLLVLVTNHCDFPWQPVGAYPTQAGVWALDPHTERHAAEDVDNLPGVIFPEDSGVVTVQIKAPKTPGSYLFRLKMIQQGRRWFQPVDAARNVQFPASVEN
jgi:hypothetical protein